MVLRPSSAAEGHPGARRPRGPLHMDAGERKHRREPGCAGEDAPRDAPQGEGQGARRPGPAGPAHPVGGGRGHPQHHPLPRARPTATSSASCATAPTSTTCTAAPSRRWPAQGQAPGGDAAPKPTTSLPKKVKLIDLFAGPVSLNARGEAEVTCRCPTSTAACAPMAVVATPGAVRQRRGRGAGGRPLVAELATPRFLTVGDSAVIALDLHNLSGAAQTFKVDVSSPTACASRTPAAASRLPTSAGRRCASR